MRLPSRSTDSRQEASGRRVAFTSIPSSSHVLLEAATAGWDTTVRLAILLAVRGAGWAWISFLIYKLGLSAII